MMSQGKLIGSMVLVAVLLGCLVSYAQGATEQPCKHLKKSDGASDEDCADCCSDNGLEKAVTNNACRCKPPSQAKHCPCELVHGDCPCASGMGVHKCPCKLVNGDCPCASGSGAHKCPCDTVHGKCTCGCGCNGTDCECSGPHCLCTGKNCGCEHHHHH